MPNWKLGASIANIKKETFDACAKAQIDVVEVSTSEEVYKTLDWEEIAKWSADSGVGIWSMHLPFYGTPKIDPACMDKAVRDFTIEVFRKNIAHAAKIGAKVAVVHPGLEPTDPKERAERLKYSGESMAKVADICEEFGLTAAVEDLPRSCVGNTTDEICEIISSDDRLRVTFDVNHLLLDSHSYFVEKLGNKIATLHISDYDFLNERHWLPGEGQIDWVNLVTLLENVNYSGPWMYETRMTELPTMNRPALTFEDLRRNYLECMNKQPLTVFGTVNEEVTMAQAYLKERVVK